MAGYEKVVFALSTLVNFLLLLGAGRFCQMSLHWGRVLVAAALGGFHGVACLLPGFNFLGNILWRSVSLLVMAMIAYGISSNALRGGMLFAVLSFILEGIGQDGFWQTVSVAGLICFMCYMGIGKGPNNEKYVPVELSYRDKHMHLTALRDTGNMLKDPITGCQVLVVGAEVAQELTGLTRQQLLKPLETIAQLPGLRLIPYHTVGSSSFLLAMRIPNVKIGSWQGSSLVAFAPEGLSRECGYEALTGGMV